MSDIEYNNIINDICHKYEEVCDMPRRDGTGPRGAGIMTGRGLGNCVGENEIRYGSGLRAGIVGEYSNKPSSNPEPLSKELLEEEKEQLKNRLDAINRQLENL